MAPPESDHAAAGDVVYDVAEWPVVQAVLPREALSIEAYLVHLERLGTLMFSRGEPCALLLDVRQHPTLNALQRRATAEFATRSERTYPGLLKGVALVSASPLARGAFAAVAWLFAKPYPRKAFDSVAQAKPWLLEQMRPGVMR